MNSHLLEIFSDEKLIVRIQQRLPRLFRIAELESSRAGKIGMQVGSARENIVVALLIYKFGENNVQTDIPITEPEVDVRLFGHPISVKTITGGGFSGVKLIWTVDTQNARAFQESYYPSSDILFVQIVWGGEGGLFCIPVETQRQLLEKIGCERYIKLPKLGTNPRGAEISKEALQSLIRDEGTKVIKVNWQKPEMDYRPYQRWVDYWNEA
ncbi:MAG: ThaI family type II restriction endonuclease [Bdellovibrionota bacterium]